MAGVILNFGTPGETARTVDSLLASTRRIDDLIVVDNGGRCPPDAFAGLGGRGRVIATPVNLGFSGGMNVGIVSALAAGAHRILLLNSDVTVPPECVGRLESALEDGRAGIVGPRVLSRAAPGRVESRGMSFHRFSGRMRLAGYGDRVPAGDRTKAPRPERVDAVSGCCMLVRREVFERAGLLDADYFFGFEDLDFCLRAAARGFPTMLVPDAAVLHEGGGSLAPTSPRRLYFAARNHLLVADRAAPIGRGPGLVRSSIIVALNLAYAVRGRGGRRLPRVRAVLQGTRDYRRGRYGSDEALGVTAASPSGG
jgi:GT2 family glycosyltransferase